MNQLHKIYILLLDNKFAINIITSILVLLYNIYDNSYILYIDYTDNNYPINENDQNYLPYHTGIVETNQGLRVELEGDINLNLVQTNQGYRIEADDNNRISMYRDISRIPHPSHFPPVTENPAESTLLGTIHSDDPSYQLGIIEPTQSQLNHNGVYWGEHGSAHRPLINAPSPLSCFTSKISNTYKKLEKKYDSEILKQLEKQRKEYEWGKKTRYIDGYGWVSNGYLRSLYKDGYTIWEGKIIKKPRIPKPY